MSGGKVGGIDRSMYRELSRAGTADGVVPVFEVAARLSRKPSFGSKTWSTDDVPRENSTEHEARQSTGSAIHRPVITAQPSHNMFSAPQPGAKPISIARLPTRANTGGGITPMALPTSTALAKMARAAAAESQSPLASSAVAPVPTPVPVHTPSPAPVPASSVPASSVPAPVPTLVPASSVPAAGGRQLTRRTTILDIERPSSSQYIVLRLYDGKRCVSDIMSTYLGLKSTTLADVTVAEFDRLHRQAREEIKARKAEEGK